MQLSRKEMEIANKENSKLQKFILMFTYIPILQEDRAL